MYKETGLRRLMNTVSNVFFKSYSSLVLPWSEYKWENNSHTYISEGYRQNSVTYFAVNKIASKCGEIPLKLWSIRNGEKTEVLNHPILELLYKPNRLHGSYSDFIQAWVSFLKLTGNAYMFSPGDIGRTSYPGEILIIPSQNVNGRYDPFGMPNEYTISFNNEKKILPIRINEVAQISHTRLFNPYMQEDGQSPLSALRHSLMLLNSTNEYAVNFVKNRCTPPGVLSTEQKFTPEQRQQLEKLLREKYSGPMASNNGMPLILWGGLKYSSMQGNGREQVAVYNGQGEKERDISRTLGVPPMLLGIPGDSTYNNILEAKKDFVLSTCLPVMKVFSANLSNWLLTSNRDEKLFLEPCIDELPEINEWRSKSLADVDAISFLTLNEKRKMSGYETFDGDVYDDVLIEPSKILAQDYDSFLDMEPVDDEETEPAKPAETEPAETEPTDPDDVEADIRKETALNGAQVTSLVTVIQAVAAGTLPYEVALELIQIAFNLSVEQAEALLKPMQNFEVPEPESEPEGEPE